MPPKKKLPGKKKFKNTTFGKRAIKGARRGAPGDSIRVHAGAGPSSVLTQTNDIPGRKGRMDVNINPTIRKNPKTGKLEQLDPRQATIISERTGDFVRVKAKKRETIDATRTRGDKKSTKFSDRLGRIAQLRDRPAKIARTKALLSGKAKPKKAT